MPSVAFTANLRRHLDAPPAAVAGATVREALEASFHGNPRLRGYLLDDQGRLRRHVMVFVDGEAVRDRDGLADPIGPAASLYVMQALSGG
ncbi:MAG: MoaD/ThiS family protein [Anaeromyxobacteraceae bacterium]|nr:MoaD/ThiS family protein [Anaeromyxobacteraceae bacterium]